jgi:hypothetical protein
MGLRHLTTTDQENWSVNGSNNLGSGAILSPAQITANVDNYNPTGFQVSNEIVKSLLRLDLDANHNVTGLVPSTTATANIVTISNISGFNLKLKNNNAGSTAANRFLFKADITIDKDESLTIYYDTVSLRWRVYNNV